MQRLKIIALRCLNHFVKILIFFENPFVVKVDQGLDCEIHLVTGHRDVYLAVNCIKTFYTQSEMHPPLFMHLDRDITKSDINMLKKHVPFANLITKEFADSKINRMLKKYKYCRKLRKSWQGMKLIDVPVMTSTKKIIIFDSDLFFLNRPKRIIDWIKKSEKINLFCEDYKHFSDLSEAEFEYYLGIKRLKTNFNSGILCLNAESFDLKFVEKTLKVIQETLYERVRYDSDIQEIEYRHLVEQTTYLAICSKYPSKPLGRGYVVYLSIMDKLNRVNLKNYVCIHFTGEYPSYKIYQTILEYIYPNIYSLIISIQKLFLSKTKQI